MSIRHTPLPQLSGLVVTDVARSACRRLGVESEAMLEVTTLHTQALVAAAEWNAPDMLTEQFAWERSRLAGIGVTLRYKELHEAVLGALVPQVDRVTHARLRVVYSQAERLDQGPRESTPPALGSDVDRYLAFALAGDARSALTMVRAALARGVSSATLVRDLLMPAQVETGRRWEMGGISVAQEHRVTAVTLRCMDLFGVSRAAPSTTVVRRVAVATVGPEGHDLGLRMLSHALDRGGWEVDYLGAGVPVGDLVDHVTTTRPHVLALSATMTAHLSAVAGVISGLRAHEVPTRVLVGGRVFATRPALAQMVGADGTAHDADSALAACARWFDDASDLATGLAIGTPDPSAPRADDEQQVLGVLADRYRIAPRHVDGALSLLAGESGLSKEDLLHRLASPDDDHSTPVAG